MLNFLVDGFAAVAKVPSPKFQRYEDTVPSESAALAVKLKVVTLLVPEVVFTAGEAVGATLSSTVTVKLAVEDAPLSSVMVRTTL